MASSEESPLDSGSCCIFWHLRFLPRFPGRAVFLEWLLFWTVTRWVTKDFKGMVDVRWMVGPEELFWYQLLPSPMWMSLSMYSTYIHLNYDLKRIHESRPKTHTYT